MTSSETNEPVVRIFRGNDDDQFESYIQFYDNQGILLSTKQLCKQVSASTDEYSEDRMVLDLDSFWFYEWESVARIEVHSDIKDICLSSKLQPKVGTIEFIDERRKDFIKRGRFSFIDEEDIVTQYDISEFFTKMCWGKPELAPRKAELDITDFKAFPVHIDTHFRDQNYDASIRFFDSAGNLLDLSGLTEVREFETKDLYEEWTVVDLAEFLGKLWAKVAVVECRSDLTSIDRFKHVKGNIDFLIYCRANNYKKLPEYLYKRIQTRKLDNFLEDIKTA